MKNMKGLVAGIIIGIILSTSAFAAVQEYSLKQSEWVITVDGVQVKDEKLPVLLMEPGYNYVPASNFRDICNKAGLPFTVNAEEKEIRITTKEEKVVSKAIAPTPSVTYFEPATIERDGVKKVLLSDISKMLKAKGYSIKDTGKCDFTLNFYDPNDKLIFRDVLCLSHEYNGKGVGFIDYEFYEKNIKPLIVN